MSVTAHSETTSRGCNSLHTGRTRYTGTGVLSPAAFVGMRMRAIASVRGRCPSRRVSGTPLESSLVAAGRGSARRWWPRL